MRIIIFFLSLLFTSSVLLAQAPKNVLVEHFTNTKCSICASRNPGFYSNLNANPNILHVAFHPSAPYNTCLLNNYNVTENDSRTNYYGVYGGTPRLVINGVVIAGSADYSNAAIFAPYTGQSADLNINISHAQVGSDSIRVSISIIKLKTVSYTTATLFAGIFEDTIFYTSPNGETKHLDVFRNSYTGAQGTSINIPLNIGDSIVYTKTIKLSSTVNANRTYSLAILQSSTTKEMIQANKTRTLGNPNGTGILKAQIAMPLFNIYPNPAHDKIIINSGTPELKVVILFNALGKEMRSYSFVNSLEIDLVTFPPGVYYLRASTEAISQQQVFIKR